MRAFIAIQWLLLVLAPRSASGLAAAARAAVGARVHHCAVRTRNIERAIKFYSLFGLEEEARFRSGSARCAWLRGLDARLELIEVPGAADEDPAPDGLAAAAMGLNHVALDVSGVCDDLGDFLARLNTDSERAFQKSIALALPPFQQQIGAGVYELAFVRDADGVLIELLRRQADAAIDLAPDW